MLRSVATAFLLAVSGIQATTTDGDFGVWHVVANPQVCDSLGFCRQTFDVKSEGNPDNKLPAFSASCVAGCTVDNTESRLEIFSGCVPGGISFKQTVSNSTRVWAAWGTAPWQSGKAGEFVVPVSKLHIYDGK